jgi:hypothetical protein
VIPQTGTVFLNDLHRRAYLDGRVQLVETAVIAALAGGLSRVRLDEFGVLSLASVRSGLFAAAAAALVWLLLGALLQRWIRDMCRGYVARLLTEAGLMYLVLEHDPHEALRPLARRENWARLKLNPAAGLDFRGRILAFLRTYPACAQALGFHPYPLALRWISRALDYLMIVVAGVFAWLVYANVLNALAYGLVISRGVQLAAWAVLALLLARSTVGMARRTGLWLALTDVLQGEVDRGRARLVRG